MIFLIYTFYLLFLGPVRIKYIALFYILLSFLDVTGSNAGGEIAHLGGALIGYLFIRQLQNGVNMGEGVIKIINLFNKKSSSKVEKEQPKTGDQKSEISQDEIDKILLLITVPFLIFTPVKPIVGNTL